MSKTETPDQSPQIADVIIDKTVKELNALDTGETRAEWLAALRPVVGGDAVQLAMADSDRPLFALQVIQGEDGTETVRYVRVDQDDFGTTLRNPAEHDLPPAEDKLAEIRHKKAEQARALEIDRAVFAEMRPLRETLGKVEEVCNAHDPLLPDKMLRREVEWALHGEDQEQPLTAVSGADLMVQFGALSSEHQQRLAGEMAEKLGLKDSSSLALREMVSNISACIRHNDTYNLGMSLGGIHNYQPFDMPEERDMVRAWMSAYATGVACRTHRPDTDKAAELKKRLEAIVQGEQEALHTL